MELRAGRRRAAAAALVSTALICGLVQHQAWADPVRPDAAAPAAAPDPSQVPAADRVKVLGKGWKASTDRAWTTSGDAAGFHVLVADQKAGYGWRTAATLTEPGFDADMWIGNACVTASGKRAVVAYAPRTFTNKPELMARGAFTAVVDLDSGAVTKLDRQASLAYFSPGCGTGESAVLTQAGGDSKNQTRLLTVDAAAGKVSRTIELAGQITSAVPVGKDIVAADAARLTRIDEQGRRTPLARTGQVPFGLKTDAEGGLVFMDRPAGSKDKGEVKRLTAADMSRGNADRTKPAVLARGTLAKMDVTGSAGGTVVITGETQAADQLPKTVQRRPDVPKDSQVTTRAEALVTKVASAGEGDPRKQDDLSATTRQISLKVLATGKDTEFTVTPAAPADTAAEGTAVSPALGSAATQGASPAAPMSARVAEDERYCAVARNDPAKQAMQPKPRQVEWAADQIVNGTLDKNVSRPANWKNLGMPAYQPQTLFPRLGLNGGGRIPAQVLLGITAQESNMWQASRVVVPGVTGNPLIGNYYGIKYASNGQQTDPWGINWAEADCGYGVTQITDGMRLHGKEKDGEVATLTTLQQEAAALDYTANIAAGQRVLADKWNTTNHDGLTVNNGDPKWIENWFFALWAYNSGYYPKAAAGSNGGLWGVGFTNNPANPLWKANRTPFLEGPSGADDYSQAAHPQDWPYQEKVIGWAARPLEGMESPGKMVSGFRAAWWTNNALRSSAKPAEGLFCTSANNCDPSKIGPDDKNDPGLGACNRDDLKCWWNQPVTWKDCTKAECGNELMRFNDTYKEEADGTAYPPNCTTAGLPANAMVIDDVPDGTPIHRPNCSQPKANSGSFDLDFATPSAKIDFQQLGAGYGGNFWFAHTRKSGADGGRMKVTGTWTLNQAVNGPAKVMVHLPDHGAHTKIAKYEIETAKGKRYRTVAQPGTGNRWVSVGAFLFDGPPKVRLTSETPDGTGDQDIAYDAIAVVPVNGTYKEHAVEAVALFDEDQNIDGDTASSWIVNSPFETRQKLYDWGLGLAKGVADLRECTGTADPTCVAPRTRQAMAAWKQMILDSGTDPVNHPDGKSLPRWIGFANPYTDRPTSSAKPGRFDTDDDSFKIRSKAEVSFIVGDDGKIVDGSEYVVYEHRTGDTHMPKYVMDLFSALRDDYGIAIPDLSYTTKDLNQHDGLNHSARPDQTGVMPGRAYAYAGRAATLTDGNQCVAALYTSGGSIGYRPMLGAKSASTAMDRWQQQAYANKNIHPAVNKVVQETFGALFNGGGLASPATGSIFTQAPPIWQELNFKACADGSIQENNRPILRYSHMPDQYLYHNGSAMGMDGKASNSASPVNRGDFERFSRAPDPNDDFPLWANPFGQCGAATGMSGNPWGITSLPPADAGTNPSKAYFCLDKNLASSPEHSS